MSCENPTESNGNPVITLLGDAVVNISLGDSYTDAGATAWDSDDGDITSFITVEGEVDTSVSGTYEIIYSVTDSDGNSAVSISRTVYVGDNNSGNVVEIDPEEGWNLYWSDEFNDGVFDTTTWTREAMAPGTVNNEWQRYTSDPSHSWEEDGNMVLKLSYDGPSVAQGNYTSARVNSAGKLDFTYGKVQAKIRVDHMQQGVWPAFWLLGSSCDEYGGDVYWPECGEIDIMEVIGGTDSISYKDREKEAWSTIHWCEPPGPDPNNEHVGRLYENSMLVLEDKIWGEEYHIYEMVWDEEYITVSLDGNIFFTASITGVNKSEFHENFFMLFNIACGGDWPEEPTLTKDVHMYVDWVRVYKKDESNPPTRPVVQLRNGTFDNSAAFWMTRGFNWEYGYPGGWDQVRSSYNIVNGEYVCDLMLAAEIWNPYIRQTALTLFEGHEYTLKFDARSLGVGRTIGLECGPSERNYSGTYYLSETLQLTTTMSTYEYSFTAPETIYNGVISFLVGLENVDVVLDNVVLIDNSN